MRVVLVTVAATLVLLAFVLGTVLLLRRQNRQRRGHGHQPWQRQDVLGVVSLVVALVLGISSTAISLARPEADPGPRPEPDPGPSSPTARGTPSPTEIAFSRLQDGSDVSLFVDVLGPAGYRRAVVDQGASDDERREWGWAKKDAYMVRALVDADEQVQSFSITSLSAGVRPDLPYLAEATGAPLRLRETSFEELGQASDPNITPDGRVMGLPAANGRWAYSEIYSIPSPLYRTFVLSYGLTGAGFVFDDDKVYPLAESLGDCEPQPCLGEVRDRNLLAAVRSAWPITTITVVGEDDDPLDVLEALGQEPLDDDVAAADRG